MPFRKVPAVTLLIIAVNLYVFIHISLLAQGGKGLFIQYGAVPYKLLHQVAEQPFGVLATVATSLFLHSGFLHLLVNMFYLWLFSHRIEHELGPLRFLLFYFFCGLCADYIYAFTAPNSLRPLVGASGAVSGVIGAYILLFPQAKVHSLLFLVVYIKKLSIPAFLIIGAWASFQFYGGLVSLLLIKNNNTAWFAHLGGFLVGLSTIRLWMPEREHPDNDD
ncbi:MAG: rhomboid family intramembrane serine protease [Nitrospirota bacterium]